MASVRPSNSAKILRNSFWFGLETVLETIVFLGTSVAVARYLGPEKMGYFSYINFFVLIVTRTGGTGLASATRKYMSEFIAQDRPGMARSVFNLALRYQFLGALSISVLGLAGILLFGDPHFRLMSCILILGITPGVMSWVPAEANNAFEDVAKNTQSAFGYLLTYGLIIFLTLFLHWDLVGIASATLVGRTVEVLLRSIPLRAKLHQIPLEELTPETKLRIRRYCLQAMGLQILVAVVWDRSEMIFLRHYSSLEQIAFYSISFGLANNLLLLPRTFGSATGITLMVESGRDPARVDGIVKNACRYLLLVVFPVHLGAAAVTKAAIRFAYGPSYAGAIPVLVVASILSIPRGFQEIPEVLMRAADRQKQMLIWLGITGCVNLVLDFLLIPRYGAVGAAWGNGLSQTFGIGAVWVLARQVYRFGLPFKAALRLLFSASLMALLAYLVGREIPGMLGFWTAVLTAIPVYVILVKLTHGLDPSDRVRLEPLALRFPQKLRRAYLATVAFVTPAAG